MSDDDHEHITNGESTDMTLNPISFSTTSGGIQTELSVEAVANTDPDELITKYQLEECSHWINENGFKRIALQFPDELLVDAAQITSWLEENVSGLIFVLGDTSYGSCCVDEVAAQHYNADSILHFGYACLNSTKRLPVFFIFDQQALDVADCCEKFCNFFPDPENKVIVFYDVRYSHAVDEIRTSLETYTNVVITDLDIPQNKKEPNCNSNGQHFSKCQRLFTIPESESIEDYSIFYIGEPGHFLLNLIFSFSKCPSFTYNPKLQLAKQETLQNRQLMRRYYLVEKIKDANVIGVLVGTLGVSDYLSCVHHLENLIKKAGKKSYTFVVGKLNIAKLSNFLEIDIFVHVACSENTLIDSKEFYQPIVTPFEVEIALNPNREWTGDYYTDFRLLLPGAACYVPQPEEAFDNTDVSLITGKMRSLGEDPDQPEPSTVILSRPDAMSVTTINVKTADEFLNQRSWKGLETKLGETPVTKAVEGDTGIAWTYTNELPQTENS